MNNIAVPNNQAGHPGINLIHLKDIVAKLFSVNLTTQQNIADTLSLENTLHQKKTIYKELLKNLINAVHVDMENRSTTFHLDRTTDGKWIHFNFDDPIIQESLMKYSFLKSGDTISKDKIQEFITSMHKNGLHYAMAKHSLRKFNEDNTPYLDVDETGIVLKKAMELSGGEFVDLPAGANSFN